MSALTAFDKRFVAERLPRDVRDLLKTYGPELHVAGGFIRSVIAGDEVKDIDLFGRDKAQLRNIAGALQALRPESKLHETDNALTLLTPNRLPVQFITRWTFDNASQLVDSFDFTVCQAAIWRNRGGEWFTACGERFYIDLAGRRLHYTSPVREEEAGGSILRVIKLVRRGYSIQVDSLGRVIARLADAVDRQAQHGQDTGTIIAGLLREVDPLLVIDGMEVVDEHGSASGEDL